jgi:plastocyanin
MSVLRALFEWYCSCHERTPVSFVRATDHSHNPKGDSMRVIVLGVVSIVCLLTAACGGGSSSPSSPSPQPTTPTIDIVGQNGTQAFSPNPASYGGQMVVFRNTHNVPHRVVLNDGSVDTGDIAPGATSRAVQMPTGGANYHCSLHPGMIGSVSMGAGGQPPACEGVYCTPY